MNIQTNLDDVGTMLRRRGLEPHGRVQQMLTVTCVKEMDPYVPLRTGPLKNTRVIAPDSVTYRGPYAQYQYYGKLMLAPSGSAFAHKGERKQLTTRDLTYSGAPKRGPFWDKRMWADKKAKVVADVANAAGGKPL